MGGVPPPLVFEVGRFVAWKEVLKDCVVKLGVLVKSWVMRWFWGGSGQVLGRSWARPGLVLGIFGLSWAAPGRSWAVLGTLGRLLGYLGRLLGALGRLLERSWAPSWSQDGAQEAQSRPQDPPISTPRRYKTMLTYKKLFRTPSWEHRESFWRPPCRKLGAHGAPA